MSWLDDLERKKCCPVQSLVGRREEKVVIERVLGSSYEAKLPDGRSVYSASGRIEQEAGA